MLRERQYNEFIFDENQRIIVIDSETTGLKPSKNNLIELCAIEIENLRITGHQIKIYLPPRNRIEEKALSLHKIEESFYKDCVDDFYNEPIKQLKSLINFIGNSLIVSHNASFDYDFLNKELEYWGIENLRKPIWRCSLLFFKKYVKGRFISMRLFQKKNYLELNILNMELKEKIISQKSFNLASCAENLGIKFKTNDLHNSEYDAMLTAKVFIMIMKIIKDYNNIKKKKNILKSVRIINRSRNRIEGDAFTLMYQIDEDKSDNLKLFLTEAFKNKLLNEPFCYHSNGQNFAQIKFKKSTKINKINKKFKFYHQLPQIYKYKLNKEI